MRSLTRALTALAMVLVAAATDARASEITVGKLKIAQPWTRVVPEGANVSAGFMTITNTGTEPDTLISASAENAGRVEIHEMAIVGGVMRMREMKPGLVIKPGETVVLKPGSFHVMFMDLKAPPKLGTPVKGTLVFEKAGTVEISYAVEAFGARSVGGGDKPQDGGRGSGAGSGSGAAKQ